MHSIVISAVILLISFKTNNGVQSFDNETIIGENDSTTTYPVNTTFSDINALFLNGEAIVDYGSKCNPISPELCRYYPEVTCMSDISRRISICRCSYIRTWISAEKICSLNVFSLCSKGIPGIPDLECTANSICMNDTLGINNSKFCRCKKGFVPQLNERQIPAFCVPKAMDTDDETDEEIMDYDKGSSRAYKQTLLVLLLLLPLILIITLN